MKLTHEENLPEGWKPADIYMKTLSLPESWREEAGEIDPERILSLSGIGTIGEWNQEVLQHTEEVYCETLMEWVTTAQEARAEGHSLFLLDDPLRRMFGFLDDEAGKIYYCGLTKVKRAAPETQQEVNTKDKRESLLGVEADEGPSSEETNLLSSIWMEELVMPLKEEWERQLAADLYETWKEEEGPWDKERVRHALGLEPYPFRGNVGDRQSGRTTEMLLEAVAAALNGEEVAIVGATQMFTVQLIRQARTMASEASPFGHDVKIGQAISRGVPRDVRIFRDHFYGVP